MMIVFWRARQSLSVFLLLWAFKLSADSCYPQDCMHQAPPATWLSGNIIEMVAIPYRVFNPGSNTGSHHYRKPHHYWATGRPKGILINKAFTTKDMWKYFKCLKLVPIGKDSSGNVKTQELHVNKGNSGASLLFFNFLFCIGVELVNNTVLTGVQQSDVFHQRKMISSESSRPVTHTLPTPTWRKWNGSKDRCCEEALFITEVQD